ncbi:hypothetical protein NCCP436_33120 [Pseudomonas sp. NCCP-436]|nr:hypothetical protein NCCP436_33120 [Pseudomonas sp. NCCP-436]
MSTANPSKDAATDSLSANNARINRYGHCRLRPDNTQATGSKVMLPCGTLGEECTRKIYTPNAEDAHHAPQSRNAENSRHFAGRVPGTGK